MKTTEPNEKSKPLRRKGLLAEEIAKEAQTTLYKAKQAIMLLKEAPELVSYVMSGELKLKQAIDIKKEAPELVPYLVTGELTLTRCLAAIKELRQLEQSELTFEEVERSFKRWLSKWPKEDRSEVFDLVSFMPYDAVAELLPPQTNLAVEIDPETNQTTNKEENNNK